MEEDRQCWPSSSRALGPSPGEQEYQIIKWMVVYNKMLHAEYRQGYIIIDSLKRTLLNVPNYYPYTLTMIM